MARLLRWRKSITGIDVNDSRMSHISSTRTNLNVSTWFLIVSARFDRLCHNTTSTSKYYNTIF